MGINDAGILCHAATATRLAYILRTEDQTGLHYPSCMDRSRLTDNRANIKREMLESLLIEELSILLAELPDPDARSRNDQAKLPGRLAERVRRTARNHGAGSSLQPLVGAFRRMRSCPRSSGGHMSASAGASEARPISGICSGITASGLRRVGDRRWVVGGMFATVASDAFLSALKDRRLGHSLSFSRHFSVPSVSSLLLAPMSRRHPARVPERGSTRSTG